MIFFYIWKKKYNFNQTNISYKSWQVLFHLTPTKFIINALIKNYEKAPVEIKKNYL
jgi:hypothetical protein